MNTTSTKVITSVQRRRRYSKDEKIQMIQETYKPGQTVSSVARQNGVFPSQLFYWRRCMENGAVTAVKAEESVVSESEYKKALAQIKELERALGKSTMKVEILKEAVRIGREKNSSRVMKENDLLLARYGRKKTQAHDGKVITLKSNTRWCSDSFSIQCFNGDRVHVAF